MKSNAREMRDLSQGGTDGQGRGTEKELFNLRFQQAMGQIENPMRLRTLRKDIAKTQNDLKGKHGRV